MAIFDLMGKMKVVIMMGFILCFTLVKVSGQAPVFDASNVDKMPWVEGGEEIFGPFIEKNWSFKFEGSDRVMLTFTVETDGTASDFRTGERWQAQPPLKKDDLTFDGAPIKFHPAMRNDTAVRCRYSVTLERDEHIENKIKSVDFSLSEVYFWKATEVIPKPDFNLAAYLKDNLRYPKKAKEDKIEGNVVVRLSISSYGKIMDAKIIQDLPGCREEVLRLIKNMPGFKPGQQNGVWVNTYYNLTVPFSLSTMKWH